MDNSKELNDPFVKKDLRMLGMTVLLIFTIFAVAAYLDAKTTIIKTISSKIHLTTLNN